MSFCKVEMSRLLRVPQDRLTVAFHYRFGLQTGLLRQAGSQSTRQDRYLHAKTILPWNVRLSVLNRRCAFSFLENAVTAVERAF